MEMRDGSLYSGPLGMKDAARAIEEAAEESKKTAMKAGALIDLLTLTVEEFRLRWSWWLRRK